MNQIEFNPEQEALLDKRVQRRLATDRAYLWAENAEEQAEAEQRIEREEVERLTASIATARAQREQA